MMYTKAAVLSLLAAATVYTGSAFSVGKNAHSSFLMMSKSRTATSPSTALRNILDSNLEESIRREVRGSTLFYER
jgi:hypothetical protein